MKEEDLPRLPTEEDANAWYADAGMADNRNTREAIEEFDLLLQPHGLEVVIYNGSSDYIFKIAKRSTPKDCI